MKADIRHLLASVIFFGALCANTATAQINDPAKPINKIIFFGDSLSDNGNLYSYDFKFLPKSPPYYDGRFSNNQVWSERLSAQLAEEYNISAVNYAFGGETAIFHNPKDGFLPYSLTMSRNSYLLHTAYQDRSQTLFVIWIGANDYMHDSVDVDGLTEKVVDSIGSNIESLISHGGLNFLVFNLPDMGETPLAKENGLSDLFHRFSAKHNERMKDLIAKLQTQYPNVDIKLYDVNEQFADFEKNTEYYNKKYNVNITNLTESCWQGGYTLARGTVSEQEVANKINEYINSQRRTSKINPELNSFDSNELAHHIVTSPDLMEAYQVSTQAEQHTGKECDNAENHLFWDHLHPTNVVHMMMADGIATFIKDNFVLARK